MREAAMEANDIPGEVEGVEAEEVDGMLPVFALHYSFVPSSFVASAYLVAFERIP